MDFLNFVFSYSAEIMQLCFGFGFFIVAIFLCRPLYFAARILKRVDNISEFFTKYIKIPMKIIVRVYKILSPILSRFN